MSKARTAAQVILAGLTGYAKEHLIHLVAQGSKIAARDVLAEFLVWCYMNIPGDVVSEATAMAKKRLEEAGVRQPDPPKQS